MIIKLVFFEIFVICFPFRRQRGKIKKKALYRDNLVPVPRWNKAKRSGLQNKANIAVDGKKVKRFRSRKQLSEDEEKPKKLSPKTEDLEGWKYVKQRKRRIRDGENIVRTIGNNH